MICQWLLIGHAGLRSYDGRQVFHSLVKNLHVFLSLSTCKLLRSVLCHQAWLTHHISEQRHKKSAIPFFKADLTPYMLNWLRESASRTSFEEPNILTLPPSASLQVKQRATGTWSINTHNLERKPDTETHNQHTQGTWHSDARTPKGTWTPAHAAPDQKHAHLHILCIVAGRISFILAAYVALL